MTADRRSRTSSLLERTMRTFWALPLLMILVTTFVTVSLLLLDRAGWSEQLNGWGHPFAIPADTASDLASTLIAIGATLLSLLFSITLIVLTIAAGNLGVRFVDRWVRTATTRISIGVYPALVAAAVLVEAAIVEGDGPYVPHLTLFVLLLAFLVSLVWLIVAFHHLSRLMHVDVSLAAIAQDVRRDARDGTCDDPVSRVEPSSEHARPAPQTGYVEAIDRDALCDELARNGVRGVLLPTVGSFVLAGSPLLATVEGDAPPNRERAEQADAALRRYIDIIDVRRESEGARFQVNLLVEAAIRALSPAVNDQFTAIDAAHRLTACFAQGFEMKAPEQHRRFDAGGRDVLHYTPVSVLSALDEAMDVFRRTVRDHPSVTCAFLEKLALAVSFATRESDLALAMHHAVALANETLSAATSEQDRDAVRAALTRMRQATAGHPIRHSTPRGSDVADD